MAKGTVRIAASFSLALLLAPGVQAAPKDAPEWKAGTAAIGFFSRLVDMYRTHVVLPVQGHRLDDELRSFADQLRQMRDLKENIRIEVAKGHVPDDIGSQLEHAVYQARQSFQQVRRFFFSEVQKDGNAVGDDLFNGLSYKQNLALKIYAQVDKHDTVAIEDELECGKAVLKNLAQCIDTFRAEVNGQHVNSLAICKNSTEKNPPPECADTGSVSVKSIPRSAQVSTDGNAVGKTPASLKLPPGKHTIKVYLAGYKDWTNEITVHAGSDVLLKAELQKQ
jgi:hypothetical protein